MLRSKRVRAAMSGLSALVCVSSFAPSSIAQTASANSPSDEPAQPHCPPFEHTAALPHHGGPHGEARLAGESEEYAPLARVDLDDRCMALELPVSAAGRAESVSSFEIDRYGNEFEPGTALAPEVRFGARFDTGRALAPFALRLEYEHDFLTGAQGPEQEVEMEYAPNEDGLTHRLRKAYGRFAVGTAVNLSAGVMTSHWGLGLLANDGNHEWEPGSARFSDPREGDVVTRVQLASGPHTDLGLVLAVGYDIDSEDDVTLPGDEAHQGFAAVLLGYGKRHSGGVYVVRRHQENEAGRATDVSVFDATARTAIDLDYAWLTLATEAALVTGTTELTPTVDAPEHDVLQLGAAFQAALDVGAFGTVFDFLYASGDQNLDDDTQHAFRADPNYEMGLLLYRYVLAAQSARGVVTAADPSLVGVPADDLERIATRGSPTNTIAVFPRMRYRFIDGLELYGGPLFAFAVVDNVDPFNTRLAGGSPHSALNGRSGRYLGTELDTGLRYRALIGQSELTVGAEGGALRPGSALRREGERRMPAVYGGRMMLRIRL